jgi:hypothetical protein
MRGGSVNDSRDVEMVRVAGVLGGRRRGVVDDAKDDDGLVVVEWRVCEDEEEEEEGDVWTKDDGGYGGPGENEAEAASREMLGCERRDG